MQLHASCVSINGLGVLITGEPQSGKTSLSIELMSRDATLVSDDRTDIRAENERLIASPPDNLRGLIEVFGLGVVRVPKAIDSAELAFQVDLQEKPERLPDMIHATRYLDIELPMIRQPARDGSIAAKILLLAQVFQQTGQIDTVSIANTT